MEENRIDGAMVSLECRRSWGQAPIESNQRLSSQH